MAIDLESRTVKHNKELKEFDKELNTEYKEPYAYLLRKRRIIKMN